MGEGAWGQVGAARAARGGGRRHVGPTGGGGAGAEEGGGARGRLEEAVGRSALGRLGQLVVREAFPCGKYYATLPMV